MAKTTIFSGGFGSGKSEIALNYVRALKKETADVVLADLDLVNPYFASRDRLAMLEAEGIHVAAPPEELSFSDVPALPLDMMFILRGESELVIDLAGDEAGATVLGSLQGMVQARGDYEMLLVINPYRPFAENLENMKEMLDILQFSARMNFTGIVSNPNLAAETTAEDVLEGHELVKGYAEAFGLPIKMLAVDETLIDEVRGKVDVEVFPLTILLRPDFLK